MFFLLCWLYIHLSFYCFWRCYSVDSDTVNTLAEFNAGLKCPEEPLHIVVTYINWAVDSPHQFQATEKTRTEELSCNEALIYSAQDTNDEMHTSSCNSAIIGWLMENISPMFCWNLKDVCYLMNFYFMVMQNYCSSNTHTKM